VALELDLSRGRGAAPDVGSSALAELLRARSSLAGQMTDEELRGRLLRETEGTTIGLPLAIAAAPADAVLWADRVLARLIDADGNVLYRGVGDSLEVHAEAEDVQTLFIPSSVFDRHENRALRLELDYSLTSLEPDDGLTMPAAGGDARFANNDRCSAEPLRNRSAVRMRCITLYRPSCYTIEAENRTNGAVAGYRLVCSPDYARGRFESRLLGGFEVDVPFAADARLEDWILRFTPYSPREHFVRHVTLPQLRLADWTLEDTR
jgi:hypothetical protein